MSAEQTQEGMAHELVETAHWMAAHGLAWGSSGNLSARIDERTFWVTASGTWFERLVVGDLVRCRIDTEEWEGAGRPSKEIGMHRAVYRQRPDARWLLHCTPPQATVLAARHRVPSRGVFVEGMAYAARVAEVEYFHPGSEELAAAVGAAAAQAECLLLRNHGVMVFDTERHEACMRLLSLEFACGLELAGAGAQPFATLPDDVVQEFAARRIYRPVSKPL
jgi:L-fuculose-phosphate aldolase